MNFNKNLLFASCIAIPVLVASPVITHANSSTEDRPLFQLNSLENERWKQISDQEIYNWLHENGITDTPDLGKFFTIPFSMGHFADIVQATRLLDLPENTIYYTDAYGFYAPYAYVLRKAYEKNNYTELDSWGVTQKGLAIMLREVFPQTHSLSEEGVLVELGVIQPNTYKPDGIMERSHAGKAIYYGLHTLDSSLLPTKNTLLSTPKYEPKEKNNEVSNRGNTKTQASFTDVSAKSPYYSVIHDMRNRGIINGYSDGSFRPSENISRQHASAMILRYSPLLAKYTADKVDFNDLSKQSEYYSAMVEMQRHKVFNVDSSNSIYPSKPITRGEVANAIVNLLDLDPIKTSTPAFKDVRGNPHIRYIEAAYQAGILTGYSDGTFKPDAPISRQHFAVMISRAIEYNETKMLHFEEDTTLFNYSMTELPDMKQNANYGMSEDDYIQKLADDFELAKQQIIAAFVSGASPSFYVGPNAEYDFMTFFQSSTYLTEAQAIQIFNYIYYTGKTIIVNNTAYQYNHSKNMIYKSSGNDDKWLNRK